MANLYQLADEFKSIEASLEDMDLDPQTLADTLESVAFPFEQKAINVGLMIRNFESLAESMKQAEVGIKTRRESAEKHAGWLREYLLATMKSVDKPKIESALLAISIRKNPASVVIDLESAVPKEYWAQPKIPDPAISKKLIKEAIDAGKIVPGAHIQQAERVVMK
ncbi:MAG: siphovirus Gp157 family protein [Halothiobacillus sp.]|jgi:hypothetical protein|nr:siphovirus Gp157 family protein [Halothiobacillus sp.]